jgi:hypothetical protein
MGHLYQLINPQSYQVIEVPSIPLIFKEFLIPTDISIDKDYIRMLPL